MATHVEKCAHCKTRFHPFDQTRSRRAVKYQCCCETCAIREEGRQRRMTKERARATRSQQTAQVVFLGIVAATIIGYGFVMLTNSGYFAPPPTTQIDDFFE